MIIKAPTKGVFILFFVLLYKWIYIYIKQKFTNKNRYRLREQIKN